ncbi:MAG: XTP/dITP diphosphatase [Clostridia bacterium]
MKDISKIVIASANKKKLQELTYILKELGIEAISSADAGFTDEIIETGKSFEENAYIKASTVAKATNLPTVADDSGLCVYVLGGAPGIYSARYAGEGATDQDKNDLLLNNLKNISNDKRKAKFVSSICFCMPNLERFTTTGEIEGIILKEPRGENGFGYDPLFYLEEYEKTMAELPAEVKNRISHRALALTEFKIELLKFKNQD